MVLGQLYLKTQNLSADAYYTGFKQLLNSGLKREEKQKKGRSRLLAKEEDKKRNWNRLRVSPLEKEGRTCIYIKGKKKEEKKIETTEQENKSLNDIKSRMLWQPCNVEHSTRLLGPLLEFPKGFLDVPWLDGRAALAGRIKEALLEFALLARAALNQSAGLSAGHIFLLLDLEGNFGQGLDHFKGEKAKDIDDVVGWLAVGDDAKAGPFAEPLALAPGEGCLTIFRPRHVLLSRHDFGALVGLAQTLERDVVHFFLLLVFFVVALGNFDRVEGRGFPGETDFGLFVLLGRFVYWTSGDNTADSIVARSDIRVCAFVVRILDVFTDVFPGEKRAQTRYFWLVVTDLEDEIGGADGF